MIRCSKILVSADMRFVRDDTGESLSPDTFDDKNAFFNEAEAAYGWSADSATSDQHF